ncbi:hypothetical protein T12_3985 [Trichinella patagoniensis]|uniref:Uncharacterized protein n=1 Tax=Trichinella patagoniensis TaxID=990121 RepID=A0A0V0Z9S3_9BILA|nr:hypothetical protein T12_3985 [Trichinella patagoniensis]
MDSAHHELTVGSTRNSDLLGRVNTPRAVCTRSDRMTPSLPGRVAVITLNREGDEIFVISPFLKLAHQQEVVLPAFSQGAQSHGFLLNNASKRSLMRASNLQRMVCNSSLRSRLVPSTFLSAFFDEQTSLSQELPFQGAPSMLYFYSMHRFASSSSNFPDDSLTGRAGTNASACLKETCRRHVGD